jgi:hypothetical protein
MDETSPEIIGITEIPELKKKNGYSNLRCHSIVNLP